MTKKEKINYNLDRSLEFLNAVINNPALLNNIKDGSTISPDASGLAANSFKDKKGNNNADSTLKVA